MLTAKASAELDKYFDPVSKNLFEHIADNLGGPAIAEELGPVVAIDDEASFYVCIEDRDSYIALNDMVAYPEGQGIGSSATKAILSWANKNSRVIKLRDVINPDFFDRFGCFEAIYSGEETEGREVVDYWYRPENITSE